MLVMEKKLVASQHMFETSAGACLFAALTIILAKEAKG